MLTAWHGDDNQIGGIEVRIRPLDVAFVVGGLLLWGLYRISPEIGRTGSLVISVVFLALLVAHVVRRLRA